MNKPLSILLAFCIFTSLTFADEGQRIAGTLTQEGHIDYFKALEQHLYPPGLATDNNGFRIFIRQFGDDCVKDKLFSIKESPEDWEFYHSQIYNKLGLDFDIAPTLQLPHTPHKIMENFYKAKGEGVPSKYYERVAHPWTLEEFPMLADWVKEVDKPLDVIADAIRKPVFFAPLLQSQKSVESGVPVNITILPLPDAQLYRSIARLFQARATYRIGQGNIDGAIDDKLTMHRLGRLTAQRRFIVSYLVGIAIEGVACAVPVNANSEHPLTEKQIRRIFESLNALPP
jgi:hypothetical protein